MNNKTSNNTTNNNSEDDNASTNSNNTINANSANNTTVTPTTTATTTVRTTTTATTTTTTATAGSTMEQNLGTSLSPARAANEIYHRDIAVQAVLRAKVVPMPLALFEYPMRVAMNNPKLVRKP